MNDFQEQQLKDLEAKHDSGSITPEEDKVRVDLLDLDEKSEAKVEADKALADAIAANPQPTPDPVAQAHDAVVAAQAAVDAGQAVYATDQVALEAVVPPVVPPAA